MNAIQWVRENVCVRLRVLHFNDDIRKAINVGTTLTTRLWLSMAGLLQGSAFLLQSPSWLSHPSFNALNAALPIQVWGVSFVSVGVLGLWRALSSTGRPKWAWLINVITCNVWACAVCVRFYGTGPTSLLSLYTVFALIALWVLVRTESTTRDTETA